MVTVQMKLQPFQTPNFAIMETAPQTRNEPMREKPTIPLGDLDAGTLAELCDDWRREVFRKAGKRDPHECIAAATTYPRGEES